MEKANVSFLRQTIAKANLNTCSTAHGNARTVRVVVFSSYHYGAHSVAELRVCDRSHQPNNANKGREHQPASSPPVTPTSCAARPRHSGSNLPHEASLPSPPYCGSNQCSSIAKCLTTIVTWPYAARVLAHHHHDHSPMLQKEKTPTNRP